MSNKRIDFNNLGGFPLTQDVLAYMQSSYRDAISGLARVCGDKVIVSGITDTGTTVTDGWILHNGELLPFVGGPKQSTYIIIDDNGTEQFEDGTPRTVYFNRYARFGSGGTAFSDLLRLDSIAALKNGLGTLNSNLTALNNTLQLHINNKGNPHTVTKKQVGLENIPNAISDDPSTNRSDVLATTRAVYATNKIAYTDSLNVGDVDHDKSIYVGLRYPISGYLVAGSLRSTGHWDYDNDVWWVVGEVNTTYFKLFCRDEGNRIQNLYFDYAIILK